MIELLVVIAIIAILASLLIPALSKVKAKGQGIQCLSNLRQLSLAWLLYADDNNDRIPPNNINPLVPSGTWVRGYLDNGSPVPDNTNTIHLMNSHLWRYHQSLGVWRCPSDKSTSKHGDTVYPRVRSVSMNSWLNGTAWGNQTQFKLIRRLSDMTAPPPAMSFVLLDEREDRINNGLFIVDMRGFNPRNPAQLSLADIPASYHNGAGVVTFADGHAEIKRWRDPRTRPPLLKDENLLITTSSANNSDVIWLQERATGLVR